MALQLQCLVLLVLLHCRALGAKTHGANPETHSPAVLTGGGGAASKRHVVARHLSQKHFTAIESKSNISFKIVDLEDPNKPFLIFFFHEKCQRHLLSSALRAAVSKCAVIDVP